MMLKLDFDVKTAAGKERTACSKMSARQSGLIWPLGPTHDTGNVGYFAIQSRHYRDKFEQRTKQRGRFRVESTRNERQSKGNTRRQPKAGRQCKYARMPASNMRLSLKVALRAGWAAANDLVCKAKGSVSVHGAGARRDVPSMRLEPVARQKLEKKR